MESYTVPLWAVLLYLVFNVAVQALPAPKQLREQGIPPAGWYLFFYRFAHGLAMNARLVFKKHRG